MVHYNIATILFSYFTIKSRKPHIYLDLSSCNETYLLFSGSVLVSESRGASHSSVEETSQPGVSTVVNKKRHHQPSTDPER